MEKHKKLVRVVCLVLAALMVMTIGVPLIFALTLLCRLSLAMFLSGFVTILISLLYFLPLPALPSLRMITSSTYLMPLPL